MKIIFLHGLESTPETSHSAKLITDNFDNVHVPHYNPKKSTYLLVKQTLKSLIDHYTEVMKEDVILIGISLGGFWALHMTEFTNCNKVILLNPAIVRGEERYGVTVNVSGEVGGHLLLNMDDEVIDNNENCKRFEGRFKIDTFQTGGHRMTNLKELIPLIEGSVDHFENFII